MYFAKPDMGPSSLSSGNTFLIYFVFSKNYKQKEGNDRRMEGSRRERGREVRSREGGRKEAKKKHIKRTAQPLQALPAVCHL